MENVLVLARNKRHADTHTHTHIVVAELDLKEMADVRIISKHSSFN